MSEFADDVASTSKQILSNISSDTATSDRETKAQNDFCTAIKKEKLSDEELEKLLLDGGEEPETHDGVMIHFDKYWPYPMIDEGEAENKQLLLIARYQTCQKDDCKLCNLQDDALVELKAYCLIGRDGKSEIYPVDNKVNETEEAIRRLKEKTGCSADSKDFTYTKKSILFPVGYEQEEAMAMFCDDSPYTFQFHSGIFRVFYHQQTINIYLDLTVPEDHVVRTFKSKVKEKDCWEESYHRDYLQDGYFDWVPSLSPEEDHEEDDFEIGGTEDFTEAILPEGFQLKLRPDQLRTLTWMMSVEAGPNHDKVRIKEAWNCDPGSIPVKARLGNTNIYLDLKSGIATKNSYTCPSGMINIKGGILADDTGSGKTITCLALIHSMPFNEERAKERGLAIRKTLPYIVPTWATCIICPSNLYKQWLNEALKCNPNFRVFGLSSVREYAKLTWKDIMTADIVLVTCQFLVNQNYWDRKPQLDDLMAEIRENIDVPGRIDLNKIHFHRLIFDEIHEYDVQAGELGEQVRKLRADSYWGLTGTPPELTKDSHIPILEYLVESDDLDTFECSKPPSAEFIDKLMKRNVPDLDLPPISHEVIWVNATPIELALMRAVKKEFSIPLRIMMCSHYQISDEIARLCGDSLMPVEKVKGALERQKQDRVKEAEADMDAASAMLEGTRLKKPSRGMPQRVIDRSIAKCERDLERATRELMEATEDYEHFMESFKTIDDGLDNMKPIKGIETPMYGSKLTSLYNYITDLLESCPDARIILFQQYQRLAKYISTALDTLSIQHVRITGNVWIRNEAIRRFQSSPDIRVCMLSSDDSVSGINLTQATHVILLHPFWTGEGEETDGAWEKQGICRAYRYGLKHTLKVVRFAVRGTVEEELTLKRLQLNL